MLKKITKNLPLINSIGLIILVCFLITRSFFFSEEIVYVDNIKLFDGFNMTKEMKKIGEKEFNSRKMILDSLYSKLQSNTVSETDKKQMMPQFVKGKEELEQFNQNFAGEESLKIWARIHDYIEDFSKENHYKLVLGSENKNTVLSASDEVDVTNKLIYYVNNKYEGIK